VSPVSGSIQVSGCAQIYILYNNDLRGPQLFSLGLVLLATCHAQLSANARLGELLGIDAPIVIRRALELQVVIRGIITTLPARRDNIAKRFAGRDEDQR
jgi:hypothetical protein